MRMFKGISLFILLTSSVLSAPVTTESVKEVLSAIESGDQVNQVEPRNKCGEQIENAEPKNCEESGLKHCDFKNKVTNFCFDGVEILNDSLVGGANALLLDTICRNQVEEQMPPVSIAYGSCKPGDEIIQLDFECHCKALDQRYAFFCKKI